MTNRGFWTWEPRGVWGPEDGSNRNLGPSAAERHILLEGEVTTPPRGEAVRPLSLRVRHRGGGGGIWPLGLRVHQEGHESLPRIFSEVRPRDGGPDRQKDVGSPVDVLVDTVARMQQDLASLHAENRLLRTPAIPKLVRAPRQAAFIMTKCHGSMERRVGNSTDKFLTLLCGRMAGTMIQRRCSCSPIWRGTR